MNPKVQHVLWCKQCRGPLPLRCPKCTEHPDRKPRVVALYGAPQILGTLPCGCVWFLCQREQCGKKVYRKLRKDGTLDIKNHFCSRECSWRVTSAARRTRVRVPCANGCGRQVERHPCEIKLLKHVYCAKQCHYEHTMKLKRANKDAKALAIMEQKRAYAQRKREEEKKSKHENDLGINQEYKDHRHYCAKCRVNWDCKKCGCEDSRQRKSICDACMEKMALEPVPAKTDRSRVRF